MLIVSIIHFMPPPILGLFWILDLPYHLPIYLAFGLPWNWMVRRPLILLVNPHPFSPPFNPYPPICNVSTLTLLMSSRLCACFYSTVHCLSLRSISCSTYTRVLAACSSTIFACRLPSRIYYNYLLIGACPPNASNRWIAFAGGIQPRIVQRVAEDEAKRKIGKRSSYLYFPSLPLSLRYPGFWARFKRVRC